MYVLPPLVTVILIVALPFLTALTLPFLETLATFLLDVAYLTVAPLARFANLIFLDLPFLRTVSSATARFFPANLAYFEACLSFALNFDIEVVLAYNTALLDADC